MYAITAAPSTKTTAVGATLFPDQTGASFRVWAPYANSVAVRLAPTDGEPVQVFPLAHDGDDAAYWSADVSDVAAGHCYQFAITNRGGDAYDPGGLPLLRADPCARQVLTSDPKQPCVVADPGAYAFAAPFRTPAFQDFIIYQAHVGSFAGRGDGLTVYEDADGGTARFDQLEAKLDYIRGLQFNAVQLLPTGEYRGSEGEAYNPSNYYAPEVLYGSPDDLRRLVDACHRRGLAVFFDVVYNHMDPTDNLWQFDGNTDHRTDASDPTSGGGVYFSAVDTPFGRRPDHDSPAVQRFFIENAAMWFREYHVDGLRFDSAVNFSAGGLRAIVQRLIADFPDKLIYAEHSDPAYVFGDIGFRACWDMGSADGFASIVGTGDVAGLQRLIGRWGYPTAYSAIKYLLGSHDQIFNQWKYDGSRASGWFDKGESTRYFVERIGGAMVGRDQWEARAKARLGWALNVAMPCTPMLFMGSECHHNGYWNPAKDFWGDHRFDWGQAGDPIGRQMEALVRDVNAVRWANPALRSESGPDFPHVDAQNRVLAFKRWDDASNVVLVVVNLGENQWDQATYGVNMGGETGTWEEVFNSQSPQYGGWNDSGNYEAFPSVGDDGRINIRLPKWSVLIFRKR